MRYLNLGKQPFITKPRTQLTRRATDDGYAPRLQFQILLVKVKQLYFDTISYVARILKIRIKY